MHVDVHRMKNGNNLENEEKKNYFYIRVSDGWLMDGS